MKIPDNGFQNIFLHGEDNIIDIFFKVKKINGMDGNSLSQGGKMGTP